MSIPSTSDAPSFAAAIESIPDPLPTSNTLYPPCIYFSIILIQSIVVSCVPVPKAMPGSISMTVSPSLGSYSRHVGFTTIVLESFVGLKYSFHLSRQSTSSSTFALTESSPRSASAPKLPSAADFASSSIASLTSFALLCPSSSSAKKTVTAGSIMLTSGI